MLPRKGIEFVNMPPWVAQFFLLLFFLVLFETTLDCYLIRVTIFYGSFSVLG